MVIPCRKTCAHPYFTPVPNPCCLCSIPCLLSLPHPCFPSTSTLSLMLQLCHLSLPHPCHTPPPAAIKLHSTLPFTLPSPCLASRPCALCYSEHCTVPRPCLAPSPAHTLLMNPSRHYYAAPHTATTPLVSASLAAESAAPPQSSCPAATTGAPRLASRVSVIG